MAPLRSKIHHTLHKINHKFKRHSDPGGQLEDQDAVQSTTQPRTLVTDGFQLPTSSQSPGQPSASSSLLQAGAGSVSSHGPDQTAQLPRTSGSGSASSMGSSLAYGFGPPSPGGSAMSVDRPDQNPRVMQPVAGTPLPHGNLGNPIGNASLGEHRHSSDPASSSSSTSFHGQKRYWADPSPLDPSKVDYGTVGQKSKMHRAAVTTNTDFSTTPGGFDASKRYPSRAVYGQQTLEEEDIPYSLVWAKGLQAGPPARSWQYQSEDDLAAFRQRIFASTCQGCSRHLAPSGDKIIARTRRILDIKDVLHPYLECPKCKTAACVACHQRSAEQGKDLPNRQSRQGVSVAWCCDEGRLFLIWSLCCGPEYEELSESVGKAPTFTRLLRKARSKGQYPESSVLSPIKPKESTPRALSKGIGYGGDEIQYAQAVVAGAPPVYTDAQPFLSGDKAHNLPEERLLPAYFTSLDILLTGFLIGGSEAELSDAQPPAMIKFMLQRSPLLPKAAELLRNDSMEDMAERRQTYEPLLGLVRTIGRYVSISVAVFDDYMLYAPEEQLVHYSPAWRDMNESSTSGGRQSQRGKGKQPESGTAIVKAVERLARQCRHINRVTSDKDDLKSADSSAMLSLSRLICDVATENEANKRLAAKHRSSAVPQPVGQMQGASNVLTRSRGAEKASDDLRDLHRDASVVDVADKELLNGFKFQAQAAGLDGVIPAPGRMKKLVSQIAMLRTSLPEGIWVRHGSSRLDVMKVLITGPKGTPYENGLFEFDLLCPMDFPARPPTMFFRTTGAGRVRFNPNLYEDGKVCLSILGTWAGPGWNAAYSTLLQVLVSMQAMIFVEEPWYNEPGRELALSKTASKRYNIQIQGYTVEHAMLDWLVNRLEAPPTARQGTVLSWPAQSSAIPPAPAAPLSIFGPPAAVVPSHSGGGGPVKDDPVWSEIIRKHFAANGKAIVETVKRWKQPTTTHKDVVTKLNEALAQHGFL